MINPRYRWYKNGSIVFSSSDIEKKSIYGVDEDYYVEHISIHKHFDGDIFLYGYKLASLGELETVSKHLYLTNSDTSSLGNLKQVGGMLELTKSKITSLGNLDHVGGHLWLCGTYVTDLGNLKTVGKTLDLVGVDLTSLGKLERVNRVICTEGSATHKLLLNSKFSDKIEHPFNRTTKSN